MELENPRSVAYTCLDLSLWVSKPYKLLIPIMYSLDGALLIFYLTLNSPIAFNPNTFLCRCYILLNYNTIGRACDLWSLFKVTISCTSLSYGHAYDILHTFGMLEMHLC